MEDQESRMLGDALEDMINHIAEEHHMSVCEASGIVAQVLMDERLENFIPSLTRTFGQDLRNLLEKRVLAKCFNDNEYIFKGIYLE